MEDWLDVIVRLSLATVLGAILGINRELHGKPTGLRTLGLVGLGSALAVLTVQHAGEVSDPDAAGRVIQGVITGIGFLGAGVIIREPGETGEQKVHGLTTAATIWVTACLGVACGFAAWRIITVAIILLALVLVAGGPIENLINRYQKRPGR
jgi:putative Mg2+ transporter-C (MgtC) family protein